jgi:hypothetical protein
MPTERNVVWSPWDEPGFEHLRLTTADDQILGDGIILNVGKDGPLRLQYRVRCDADWRVLEVAVNRLDSNKHEIALRTDGNGHWSNESGNFISALDGCFGVDISATPFTNTLAIRQLKLKPGESGELAVVFIAVPQLEVTQSRQRYTCLELNSRGGSYRFEDHGLFEGFTADLEVDAGGLVLDYPKLFRRILPKT